MPSHSSKREKKLVYHRRNVWWQIGYFMRRLISSVHHNVRSVRWDSIIRHKDGCNVTSGWVVPSSLDPAWIEIHSNFCYRAFFFSFLLSFLILYFFHTLICSCIWNYVLQHCHQDHHDLWYRHPICSLLCMRVSTACWVSAKYYEGQHFLQDEEYKYGDKSDYVIRKCGCPRPDVLQKMQRP